MKGKKYAHTKSPTWFFSRQRRQPECKKVARDDVENGRVAAQRPCPRFLSEGVCVEDVHIGGVIEGHVLANVPGAQAGPSQGRGLFQLQEAEPGKGAARVLVAGLVKDLDEP